jgi:hypothetical protein
VASLVALLRAVGRLALPCEDQVVYLEQLGGSVDELALEFSDGAVLIDQFVASGWLSADDGGRLREINEALTLMSGPENAALWTGASLCSAEEWRAVRNAARQFLAWVR